MIKIKKINKINGFIPFFFVSFVPFVVQALFDFRTFRGEAALQI